MKFNHKQVVVTTALGCLIIWFLRLDLGNDENQSKSRTLEALVLPKVGQSVAWQPDKLAERLVAFLPRKETVKVDKTPAPSAVVASVPTPKPIDKTLKPRFSMLDDNHQVGLLAIIEEKEVRFAILQKINFVDSQTNNIKVKNNTEFSGFTLTINSQTEILLSNPNRQIALNLFKPRNS